MHIYSDRFAQKNKDRAPLEQYMFAINKGISNLQAICLIVSFSLTFITSKRTLRDYNSLWFTFSGGNAGDYPGPALAELGHSYDNMFGFSPFIDYKLTACNGAPEFLKDYTYVETKIPIADFIHHYLPDFVSNISNYSIKVKNPVQSAPFFGTQTKLRHSVPFFGTFEIIPEKGVALAFLFNIVYRLRCCLILAIFAFLVGFVNRMLFFKNFLNIHYRNILFRKSNVTAIELILCIAGIAETSSLDFYALRLQDIFADCGIGERANPGVKRFPLDYNKSTKQGLSYAPVPMNSTNIQTSKGALLHDLFPLAPLYLVFAAGLLQLTIASGLAIYLNICNYEGGIPAEAPEPAADGLNRSDSQIAAGLSNNQRKRLRESVRAQREERIIKSIIGADIAYAEEMYLRKLNQVRNRLSQSGVGHLGTSTVNIPNPNSNNDAGNLNNADVPYSSFLAQEPFFNMDAHSPSAKIRRKIPPPSLADNN